MKVVIKTLQHAHPGLLNDLLVTTSQRLDQPRLFCDIDHAPDAAALDLTGFQQARRPW